MRDIAKMSEAENKADSERLYAMFAAIRHSPVPVIGRINGSGLGGLSGVLCV
jgi:enoyl-CoA hydratase/carnithine racemase